MAKKLPKAPKAKKAPKKPKASASLATWERWHERAKQVQKDNAQRMSDYKKKVAKIHADEKKRQHLIKSANS